MLGAQIGKHVHIYNSAVITFPWKLIVGDGSTIGEHARIYNLGTIKIGHGVTISQNTHLCGGTHEYADLSMPLIKASIVIENKAWICADAFIGPEVIVHEGAVVGARSVVVKDIDGWTVVAGNPATFIKHRDVSRGTDA